MKYILFLTAILVVTGMFLPQDVAAQKRSSRSNKRSTNHGKVKRTVIVKKAKPKLAAAKPKVGLMPALVVPRCGQEDGNLNVTVYGYPLTIQYMEFKEKKLWVKKADGTLSSERVDFLNLQDYNLALLLSNIFESTDLEMHPAMRSGSSYIATLVFKNKDKKWTVDDGEKVYQVLKTFLEPKVPTTPIPGECTS